MDLWKYGQFLTIQKPLIIKWLKFSKKDSSHELLSYITLYIES
jgi:hypothetical protein